jgi:dTDP-4-dehydrorhamnose reductase
MASVPPRVLILGGTGMLGAALARSLARVPGWQVRFSQRREPDAPGYFDALAPAEPLDRLIAERGGTDLVLNAIGLTQAQLSGGDARSADADAINARLPHRVADAAERACAAVIHFSTDGVFSGRSGPYDEEAEPDPVDLYGRTKLAGEVARPHVLTLRCSMVGPDPEGHRGLFEWFRRLAPGTRAPGFTDQRWNGVTTVQLAELCRVLIERGLLGQVTATSPVRHFCPNRPVTKFQLLQLFAAALGTGVTVEPVESGIHLDRVLVSRWDDLTTLAGGPTDMADAVRAMVLALPHLDPRAGNAHG